MIIEASPVSETTIQDASVLESCVQRKFAPAPIWTKAMLAALQIGVKGGKWHSLIDKVSRLETLRLGWAQVERNAGAAGVDRMSVERFAQAQDVYLAELAGALRDGSYAPQPVRRVYIPKGKGRRPLGIPAVKDRVVQAALKLVIEPIFEHEFEPTLRDRSRVVPRSDSACVFTKRSVVKMQALRNRVESLESM
jgi:RNA-directed DNA polymerase